MRAISLFAGVGGIDLGFSRVGIETIWANDFDSKAAQTYSKNFKNKIVVDDIRNINIDLLPQFDVLLAGFPCQAFSLAGYRKGFKDERGTLFFEIAKIIEERKPKVIFLENVKNLIGHDNGNTFQVILDVLKSNGYYVKHSVLNACEYGDIPQNRERIYIVAFDNKEAAQKFNFPDPVKLSNSLHHVIDYSNRQDSKYYYLPEKCKFYDKLEFEINEEGSIYQWRRQYVRKNKSKVCPTLTANMGTGGHNVPLVYTKHGIRKLTPRECFNLQGFPEDYRFPEDISNTSLYKQAGNSVAVPVIERIACNIVEALDINI